MGSRAQILRVSLRSCLIAWGNLLRPDGRFAARMRGGAWLLVASNKSKESKDIAMSVLKFVCPGTGNVVDTGMELDAQSFAHLPRNIATLGCPHCEQPHLLAHVQAWLGTSIPSVSD